MIRTELLPTADDVRLFAEHGYWLGGQVVDGEQLARLRQAMDEVYAGRHETGRAPWSASWRPGDDPLVIRKTDNAHWANPTIRALALDSTIGAMAARLMAVPAVSLWHDQLLYKPGQGANGSSAAGNVGWHQDHHYWQCTTPDLITAWVAFDDVTVENGCMQVVPGSQRWGLLPESDFFNTDIEVLRGRISARTGRPFTTVPCTLRAGEVSFHHCLTVHGSGPNLTARPRRSLVIHLMPSSATWIAGTPCDAHMNVVMLQQTGGRPGDRFAGPAWPTLYPAV